MCWAQYEERWELREARRLDEEIRELIEAQQRPEAKPEPEPAERDEREPVEV